MGIDWKDIKEELGLVKTAPYILCFVLGCSITWWLDARTLSNYKDEIALYEIKLKAREAEITDKNYVFNVRLATAVQTGESGDPAVQEALSICKRLWPDIKPMQEDVFLPALEELEDHGCGGPDCKLPASYALYRECESFGQSVFIYQKMRPLFTE